MPHRDPSAEANLLRDAAERSIRYLEGLDARRVGPTIAALQRIEELGGALADRGCDAAQVIADLDRIGSDAVTGSAGGRYFGFVIGGALPVTVAANWLAAAWDQNAATSATSPFGARIEEIVFAWISEVLGLPPTCAGALVTGASVATLTALAAARTDLLARRGWDARANGVAGSPPIKVVVSDEVHVTVLKAMSILGIGTNVVTRVPTDDQGRMRIDALPPLDDATIVCVQAGNVNTGSFDPIGAICAAARPAGAWVHVDGAFGLWAAASPRYRHLCEGIAQADSWATDAHKWLNIPQDCGIALVRNEASLRSAMSVNAAYLVPGGRRDPAQYGPELSRRARGIELWSALRYLGRDGVQELIERTCGHARWLSERLRSAGFDILNEVVLNQVLVSLGDERRTGQIIERIQNDGECWAGSTVWHGRPALRVSVSGWATNRTDMERTFAAILKASRESGAPDPVGRSV